MEATYKFSHYWNEISLKFEGMGIETGILRGPRSLNGDDERPRRIFCGAKWSLQNGNETVLENDQPGWLVIINAPIDGESRSGLTGYGVLRVDGFPLGLGAIVPVQGRPVLMQWARRESAVAHGSEDKDVLPGPPGMELLWERWDATQIFQLWGVVREAELPPPVLDRWLPTRKVREEAGMYSPLMPGIFRAIENAGGENPQFVNAWTKAFLRAVPPWASPWDLGDLRWTIEALAKGLIDQNDILPRVPCLWGEEEKRWEEWLAEPREDFHDRWKTLYEKDDEALKNLAEHLGFAL